MAKDFDKNPPHCKDTCPATGFQDVVVCVPVEVKPFANVGKVKTQCLGGPEILSSCEGCDFDSQETCRFTISQRIRVEVPVVFGAKTETGGACIDCGYDEDKDKCKDKDKDMCDCYDHKKDIMF